MERNAMVSFIYDSEDGFMPNYLPDDKPLFASPKKKDAEPPELRAPPLLPAAQGV